MPSNQIRNRLKRKISKLGFQLAEATAEYNSISEEFPSCDLVKFYKYPKDARAVLIISKRKNILKRKELCQLHTSERMSISHRGEEAATAINAFITELLSTPELMVDIARDNDEIWHAIHIASNELGRETINIDQP